MPLTPQEQRELAQLEQEVGGLTPEEAAELAQLEAEFGGLTPAEHQEMLQLEQEVGQQPSQLEAGVRGTAQGLAFGWADELEAAFKSGSLFRGPEYEAELKKTRGKYEAAKKAHPGTYLTGEIGGGIATAMLPGMGVFQVAKGAGVAKSLATAGVAGATFGGIEGAGRSTEQELKGILKDATTGAAIGAGASIGLTAIGKGVVAGTKMIPKKTINFLDNQQVEIANGAADILRRDASKNQTLLETIKKASRSTDDAIIAEQTKFGSFLLGRDNVKQEQAISAIKKAVKNNEFESKFAAYRQQEAMLEYVENTVDTVLENSMPGVRKIRNMVMDAQYVYQSIDDKFGTELQPLLNQISADSRKAKAEIARLNATYMKDIRKLIAKSDADEETLFRALDKNQTKGLSKNDQALVNRVRDMTKDMHEVYTKVLKLPVEERTSYFPAKLVDTAEYINRIDKRTKDLITKYSQGEQPNKWLRSLDEDDFSGLYTSDDVFAELVDGLALGQTKATDGVQLLSQLQSIRNPMRTFQRLSTDADALYQRTDAIPDFLRDKNIENVLLSSAFQTIRHGYMRDNIAKLGAHIPVLKRLGDDTSADYLARHLADMTGTRSTLASDLANNIGIKWRTKIGQMIQDTDSEAAKSYLQFVRDIPAITSSMANNVYVNFLGLNPKAVIRNLAQPYVLTSPTLAGSGNPKHVARAAKYAMKAGARNMADVRGGLNYEAIKRRLIANNHAPPEYTAESKTFLEQVLKTNSPITHASQDFYKKVADKAMYFYEASDIINRNTTVHIAKQLADDFIKGDEIAKAMIKGMSSGYRSKIARATNPNEIREIITDNLLSTTQFNYDRVSLSEFGRSWGPIFSVFTKWPTSIAGDIITQMARKDRSFAKNLSTVGMKYGSPLLLGIAADSLLFRDEGPSQASTKYIVGSGGFSDWMPVHSLKSIIDGGIMSPPVVQSGKELVSAIAKDEPGAVQSWVKDQTKAYAPGGIMLRLFEPERGDLAKIKGD